MVLRKRIAILQLYFIMITTLFISGCASTYYYISGEKGQIAVTDIARILANTADQNGVVQDRETKKILSVLDKIADPKGDEPVKEMTKEEWDSLSGVEYEIRTGEKAESIIEKLGQPKKRENSDDRKYDEVWEYDFCKIYFKNSSVRKLIFINTEEPAFRWESKGIF